MADLNFDLAVAQAMADELETYLQRDVLYWQMAARGPMSSRFPKMTLGGLLLRLQRLKALRDRLAPQQQSALDALDRRVETAFSSWSAAYDARLQREIEARLNAWARYIAEDCTEGRSACADYYPSQAEVRTMLALLLDEAARVSRADLGPLQSRLAVLDSQFKGLFGPGAFIWDPSLAPAYPPDRFWWLYREIGK
jgi:hypothetical protein